MSLLRSMMRALLVVQCPLVNSGVGATIAPWLPLAVLSHCQGFCFVYWPVRL